ncbi:MAG: acyl-CoA dehydrogenase family protein [Hyphomicrobiales bacterium]|nr:acyl-CoA dehydrogenase family protein [Hyphomicrobiales bacterium]
MLESEEETQFRDVCRRFAAKEIAPRIDAAERTGVYPRELRKIAGKAGLLGITAPEEFGGAGAPMVFQCIAIEEFASVCAGLASGLNGLGARMLVRVGTGAQKERYLKPTLAGDTGSAFAMTEPDAGSDVLALRTTAKPEGNGWRITGSKLYATGAPCSDYMIVVAYTDRDKRRDGLSLFLVDTDTEGVEIHKMDKLGHRSMETGAVFLDCVVPASALLGEAGQAMPNIMELLEEGRITHAARSLGVARGALDLAVDYASQRRTFGRKINEYQIIQMKLAQMLTEFRSAKLHVYDSARQYDAGAPTLMEACMAKLVASEAAVSITDQGMRIFAGAGYINESPINRFFRDARLYPISEGTNEIQMRTICRLAGIM